MSKVLWVIAIIGTILGTWVLAFTLSSAEGAPQEAAGAGIALCLTVIPYCLARAVSELQVKK